MANGEEGGSETRAAPYLIRRARVDDAGPLAEIEKASFDPTTYGGLLMTARSFRRHALGNNILLVAEPNFEGARPVVGYAIGFVKKGSPYVRFYSLAVMPEHGGRGAAWRLFAAMEDEAKRRGCRGVRLEIRADNTRLKARYLRSGYKVFATIDDYYSDHMAAIRMVKDFDRDSPETAVVK